MVSDYFFLMLFVVCCTNLGFLLYDAFRFMLRHLDKFFNLEGNDWKTGVALVLFLEFIVFSLGVSVAFFVYLVRL